MFEVLLSIVVLDTCPYTSGQTMGKVTRRRVLRHPIRCRMQDAGKLTASSGSPYAILAPAGRRLDEEYRVVPAQSSVAAPSCKYAAPAKGEVHLLYLLRITEPASWRRRRGCFATKHQVRQSREKWIGRPVCKTQWKPVVS